MPDPNLEAGHTCLLDLEDCFDLEGNWTKYSCEDVQTLYTNSVEVNASDMLQLDMASESLKDICCNDTLANSKVPHQIYWWNAIQEWHEGHSKNIIIIKGVISILSVIASSIFMWMILRSRNGLPTTSNLLLLGLCTADVCFSLPLSFFGMMLQNEVGYYSRNAMRSMATCQIQGFMNAFGTVCGPCYNTSLVRRLYASLPRILWD